MKNKKTNKNKVILNERPAGFWNLLRTLLCKNNDNYQRGRSQIKFGMTSSFYNGAGFTLIELLVVVLIIGILAAVALPQYQFSVDKTRAMTHFQNIQGIIKAEQLYKMANGSYTKDFELLDIDWMKTCKRVTGVKTNELAECPGNFGFQMNSTQIWLRWCKSSQKTCDSNITNYHLLAKFSMTNGSIIECIAKTNRGQKLCDYFSRQFSSPAE